MFFVGYGSGRRRLMANTICDCGKKLPVRVASLVSGSSQQCSNCASQERSRNLVAWSNKARKAMQNDIK